MRVIFERLPFSSFNQLLLTTVHQVEIILYFIQNDKVSEAVLKYLQSDALTGKL